VTDAVEQIVEANTLLSGVGFESGGLAAAHSVAQGFPAISHVHADFLHGEMVAMGLLIQFVLEDSIEEARDVAAFFARIGLPIHLGQLGLSADARNELELVADVALSLPIMANEPFPATRESLVDAMFLADALGREIAGSTGDTAWRKLHSN
jgi:glycerol dehydrogenase